jgi:AcrR family transcriptional regulator
MPGDPLFDTLFRSTVATPAIASAAPVLTPGTRSRAGNAMPRTRGAILDGARRAVEISGTKITMAQVAAAAGVAKATLYNHFRTREAVLAALLVEEVTTLADRCGELPLADALQLAAVSIGDHPLLRALARVEPATLAGLARVDAAADGWRLATEALDRTLRAHGRSGATFVLRWLASHMLTPSDAGAVAADVDVVLTALPAALPASAPATGAGTEAVHESSGGAPGGTAVAGVDADVEAQSA